MINIPSNIYSYDLFHWVVSYPCSDENSQVYKDLLKRLLYSDFQTWNLKDFSEEDRILIRSCGWEHCDNKEICARANEVLLAKVKDTRNLRIKISNLYLDVYEATKNWIYFYRSIIVRCTIKSVCDADYFTRVEKYLVEHNAYQVMTCLEFLVKSYGRKLPSIVSIVQSKMHYTLLEHDYREQRAWVEILKFLNEISHEQADYMLALSYEQEADWGESQRADDVFNMQTHILYKDAYQKIHPYIQRYPNDDSRILRKMKAANIAFAEMMSKFGVKSEIVPNERFCKMIDEECRGREIQNVYEALGWLYSIPWPTKEIIDKYIKIDRDASSIMCMFGETACDAEGNTIGSGNAENAIRTDAHRRYRMNTIYAILQYLRVIIVGKVDCSENALVDYMSHSRAPFVDNTTVMLLAKGLSFGLVGDVVTAVHLLMPSLEAMLRQFANWKHHITKNYANDIQENRMLGAILECIKTDLDETEWFELHSFLESGIDENYRNNLLHGNLPINIIHNRGIYLMWICIKLFLEFSQLLQTGE